MSASNDAFRKYKSRDSAQELGDTLRWAFDLDESPALAGAAFLTREIIPTARDPYEAVTDPATTVRQLEDLKSAYKLLRTSGSSSAERILAGKLYAATIAAALVRHGARISTQSPATLSKAFEELASDGELPERIRELAALASDAVKR
jgi:hypothetical protein